MELFESIWGFTTKLTNDLSIPFRGPHATALPSIRGAWQVLKEVSLHIEAGKTTALVGFSGSGGEAWKERSLGGVGLLG